MATSTRPGPTDRTALTCCAGRLDAAWLLPAFVTMLMTPQRRALHDLIAGTTVIDSAYQSHPAIPPAMRTEPAGW